MASNVVKVTLLADAKGFQKGMADADAAAKKTEGKASQFAGSMQAIFAGAAAGAVVKFAADAVTAFSDLEQSTGGVEAVFGEFADTITSQAEGAAEAFGLSASDFQDSAVLIGSMLKNQLGLSAEEAADQVDDLTGRAADMAATFGGTTAEAIEAIGSLMRGERDPIEKYGVSMNDAAIQAKALESGLADSTDEMTPQIKAAAALELLYEQTGDAAGQFAEESDTLAGSQQRLAAQVENVQAKLGEILAPAVESATGVLSDMVTVADALIAKLDELEGRGGKAGLPGVSDAAIGMIPIIGQIYTGFQNFKTAIGGAADALTRDALPAMEDARTHGVEPLTGKTDDLTGAEQDLAGAVRDSTQAIKDHAAELRAQTDPVFAYAEAQRDLDEAVAGVTTAEEEFGRKSPEYQEALGAVRDAALDVKDAEADLATQGGTTREEMEGHLRGLRIYTEEQIQLMLTEFDKINAFRFDPKTIAVTHKVTGGGVQEFATGGVVQGTPGKAVPIIAHAGETVLPTRHASNGGGGVGGTTMINNITVNAGLGSDPNAISKAIVESLQRYQRANGAIPIRTRP